MSELNNEVHIINGVYEVLNKIGEGGYGNVFLVLNKNDKKNYALKMITDSFFDESEREEYLKEIDLLKECENENLLNYIEHFVNSNHLCIVTEFNKDGDLARLIELNQKENKKFTDFEILNWTKQLANGLDYLHSIRIEHSDVKPKNIFKNGNLIVLGDLGVARTMDKIKKSSKLTESLNYISPEKINDEKIGCLSDIWSFGCVLFELVELKKAFSGKDETSIINSILNDPLPELKQKAFQVIFKKCLHRDPDKRSKAKDIFYELDKIDLEQLNNFEKILEENSGYSSRTSSGSENKMVLAAWIDYIYANLILIEKTKKTEEDEMKFAKEAIEILEKAENIDLKCGEKLSEIYEKIAYFNQDKLRDYDKALVFHQKELNINRKLFECDNDKIANSLNNLGNVYDNLNDYDRSLDHYNQSLEMRERLHKGDHRDKAITLNNIGRVYKNLSEYEKSIEYHLNALNMRERLSNGDNTNPDIASSLFNLGMVYYYVKDYEKSLEFQLQSLEIRKKLNNNENFDLADSLNNIGFLYFTIGDYKSSIEYHKNALDAYKRVTISNSQNKAVLDSVEKIILNIASSYEKLGDSSNAEVYKQKSESFRTEPKSVACLIS